MSILNVLRKEAAVERLVRFIRHADPVPKWDTWYVGVTHDPQWRLFNEHRAVFKLSTVIPLDSEEIATKVEKHLIEKYGLDGNPGSGYGSRFVYIFKKTADTDPSLDES